MSIAGSYSIADQFVRTTAFLLVPRVRVVGAGLSRLLVPLVVGPLEELSA